MPPVEETERGELLAWFLVWFRLATAWLKLNLEILEDRRTMARSEETGELQPAMEEFFHPGFEALRAEAIAEANAKAIAREREGLQLQTEHKFGAETAERLGTLLATVDDPDRLRAVAAWIIDCTQGRDLLARLQGSA